MGLFSSQIVDRVNVRAGIVLLVPLLGLAAASVIYWDTTERAGNGNVLPYLLLQGYVIVVLLFIAILYPSRYTRAGGLYYIFAWYLLSKALEAFDAEIFDIGHLISGHTLKHFAAAGSFTACWMLAGRAIGPPRPERPKRAGSMGCIACSSTSPGSWYSDGRRLRSTIRTFPGGGRGSRSRVFPRVCGVGVLGGSPAPRVLGAGRRVRGVFVWWSLIPASHDRPWRGDCSHAARDRRRRPRALHGVRNFEFRTRTTLAPLRRREVSLTPSDRCRLLRVVLVRRPVGDTFLSFLFDNAPPLSHLDRDQARGRRRLRSPPRLDVQAV